MNTALLYPCVPILLTETSSDITEEFLSENKNKIYVANTHKEIYEAKKGTNAFKKFLESKYISSNKIQIVLQEFNENEDIDYMFMKMKK